MSKIAFLFAGQGSQAVGMGKDLYENIPAVAKLFDEAEKYRKGTLKQMFEGEDEELKKKTEHILSCLLSDNTNAHILMPDGKYERVDRRGKAAFSSQENFCRVAEAEAKAMQSDPLEERVFTPETKVVTISE